MTTVREWTQGAARRDGDVDVNGGWRWVGGWVSE